MPLARLLAAMALLLVAVNATRPASGSETKARKPAKPKPLTPAEAVAKATKLVHEHLAKRPNYKAGDLIAVGDVEPMFKDLEKLGWTGSQLKDVRARLLDDNSITVRELRTPAGMILMRQSAHIPGGFDRLDRLGSLPDGQIVLRRLMTGPDGWKLIEYMVAAPGGQQLGVQLSRDPGAGNFNVPTGRIYTADQLLAELKRLREPASAKDAHGARGGRA
ncbi:MAG TPA: hypothetical protein VHZ24_08480 [Pirellulales bacterium]|nr:hypothetical protein [Pirellulales bacterium]